MSKRAWTLLVVLVVVGGLVGGYFWLTRPKPAPAYDTGGKVELSKGDKETLAKIVLTDRAEGTLTLVKKGTAWATDPPSPFAFDATNLDDLLYSFAALFAERTIDESPTDLAQYGLAPPKATAIGTWADGTVKTLYLGDRTPAGNTYYLQVKGDPKVYTVWMNNGQHFHWTAKDLRSKTLEPALNYEEITSLKLVQRDGTVIEAKEKTAEESAGYQFGFSKYIITRPYAYVRGLDSEKQDAFIKGPQAIAISDFIEDNPRDLSRYGLDRPWGEAVVRDKANVMDFLFGAAMDGSRTYFMIKGRPIVYAVETSNLSFMNTKAFDLVDKFSFIPNIEDVDRIDITAAGVTHKLTLSRTTKKAEKAGDPDEVVTAYTANGKSVEEDSFKKFYQQLIGLMVEGEVTRPVIEKPEVSVRFFMNKGSSKSVLVTYTPYDRDFDAIFIDGRSEFALTRAQLTKMLATLEVLARGDKVSG
jgi:hypothetical protein